jgi:2-hydroxychromene-2-carboxylate isomerase
MRQLEFFFDYGSPYGYLADSRPPALAEPTGAEVRPHVEPW